LLLLTAVGGGWYAATAGKGTFTGNFCVLAGVSFLRKDSAALKGASLTNIYGWRAPGKAARTIP
jgi:hypothetical protein